MNGKQAFSCAGTTKDPRQIKFQIIIFPPFPAPLLSPSYLPVVPPSFAPPPPPSPFIRLPPPSPPPPLPLLGRSPSKVVGQGAVRRAVGAGAFGATFVQALARLADRVQRPGARGPLHARIADQDD